MSDTQPFAATYIDNTVGASTALGYGLVLAWPAGEAPKRVQNPLIGRADEGEVPVVLPGRFERLTSATRREAVYRRAD